MKRIIAIVFMLIILCGCENQERPTLKVGFLNVGNADCQIITIKDKIIVVDTGLNSKRDYIFEFLKNNNIQKIDALILTHFDKDHIGNAAEIINNYNIDLIYETSIKKSTESKYYKAYREAVENKGNKVIIIKDDLEFEFYGAKFKIYGPKSDFYLNNESNNSSLVLSINYYNSSFLFSADIEKDRMREDLFDGIEKYDVLKIAHHGYYEDNTYEYISAVKPKFSVISTSTLNPPSPETITKLYEIGSKVYLTNNGDVIIETNGYSYKIKQK